MTVNDKVIEEIIFEQRYDDCFVNNDMINKQNKILC